MPILASVAACDRPQPFRLATKCPWRGGDYRSVQLQIPSAMVTEGRKYRGLGNENPLAARPVTAGHSHCGATTHLGG